VQDTSTERVGRYQLLEPIGGGPNGSVARAKVFGVAGFERQFAIKRFLPELAAAASSAQALSAAARSYGSLEHPRIARMSEFGVAQGQTFTAVELVGGLDLQRLVAESRLGGGAIPAGGSLALISQAARAVGYAHGRGLSHLGLSPTNVIVTAEGDVKVTDFGILAATIPAKPVEVARLAGRIGYLAPEQLVGEATSAATDVFVLGVIAYELVTGQRAFFGDSPQAIANAILAGPPAEPPLPRPIVRVLSRCLARSQFERFPDARAFADALDAALRVAPVPGTRKDIGAQVKASLDRHAAMNEGNLSGVLALNLGGVRPPHADEEAVPTTNFVRPDVEVPGPAPLVGPKPALTSTMPGLAMPPPIPSPVTPPPIPMIGGKRPVPPVKPGGPIPKLGPAVPSIVPPVARPPGGLPSIVPPALRPAGAIPSLRTTQPGPPPAPVRSTDPEIDDFGRPRAALVGPTPGLGAPGRPPSNPGASRALSENDVATLPGSDLEIPGRVPPRAEVNDEATRPGEYLRAESDFSDLAPVDPASTLPDPPARKKDLLADDPPTAPHDVLPEVHARGGLQPFARRDFVEPEPTNTSPSIEIIRAHDSQDPDRNAPITSPPFVRDMATSEMAPELVQDLKRASVEEDPLVELALEAHTRGAIGVHDEASPAATLRTTPATGAPAPLTSLKTPPTGAPSPNATLFGVGRAGHTPASGLDRAASPNPNPELQMPAPRTIYPRTATHDPRPRMPSPSPPSLVPPGIMPPEVRVADPIPAGLAPLGQPVPGTVQSLAPPPPMRGAPGFQLPTQQLPLKKQRWPLALGVVVGLGALAGVVAWQLQKGSDDGSAKAVVGDAAIAGSDGSAIAVKTGSGSIHDGSGGSAVAIKNGSGGGAVAIKNGSGGSAVVATAPADAGVGSGSGSAKPVIAPTGTSDALQIASTPAGARVFIDGADQGVTPVKLSGSADRHTMALLLAGHELYVAEVDGHGAFQVPLKPVTPSGGPAGIKVIKCKDKDRYYVFVDGKATGMTCPTERIETTTGPHTVEVYDLVTENRRKWDINVADTRLSYRVRVD